MLYLLILLFAHFFLIPNQANSQSGENVPEWAQNVIWYQIFPERFRDGDPSNNPTLDRIWTPGTWDLGAPDGWEISPWTSDWYQRPDWEQRIGPRFFDSVFSRRYGGDLQGVIDKLDYLQELGITGIYFNPIFDAVSLHKYDASTFHHIDRFFGPDPVGDLEIMLSQDPADPSTWQWTSADLLFLELLEKAAERDIRIIIDGVWNHTGRDFWAFRDIIENGEDSAFSDWYKIKTFSDDYDIGFDYDGWWGYKGLPEFTEVGDNLHEDVKQHIFDVTERWMAPNGDVSKGIAGWRLDVAEEVGLGFWRDWHAHVRAINPDAFTVAEVWGDGARELIAYDLFDAVMNYRWTYPTHTFFIHQTISASDLIGRMDSLRAEFPASVNLSLQNLMDSHDTERLASMIVNADKAYKEGSRLNSIEHGMHYDVRKPRDEEWDLLKLIALFQFTYKGSPMVYHGTEAGMWGADDPDDRKPMVWPDLDYDDEVNHPFGMQRPRDPVVFKQELYEWYSQLASIRNSNSAIQTGNLRFVYHNDDAKVFAFIRTAENGEIALVLINRGEETYRFKLGREQGVVLPRRLEANISGSSERIRRGQLQFDLAPVSGEVFTNP